ncbi:MAG: hypothetical protein NC541_14185 [bacterium]|nr:hypothetical protein [bacterium]
MKRKTKRKYKDTVFRMLFRDRKHLLELYGAVSGKKCADPEALEIVTLENAIYMGLKNDLAFLVDFHLYLYEHQSTVNPNMPFRFLQYITEEYGRLTAKENFYGSRRVLLPVPHFIVFYNGKNPCPERQVMKLSDAFRSREDEPQLELQVLVLNINSGYNTEIKEQCRTLDEYMQYVDRVRKYAAVMPMEEAVDRAVDECIREGILREFLLANKAEVKRMSIYEYDEEATRQAIRVEEYERGMEKGIEEGMQKGMEKGIAKGMEKGIEEGMQKGLEKGIEALIYDNLENGFAKDVIVAKLVRRFGISEARAEAYYEAAAGQRG